MRPSVRGSVSPFLIMEAFSEANALARAGKSIIHLSLGQPAKGPPQAVLEAASKQILSGNPGYTDAAGIPDLRERISAHYKRQYGVVIAPERVFVTIGSSSAFLLSMLAVFDKGDEVAIALPCYPAYPNMLRGMDLQPVFLQGTKESRFQPTPPMLDALPKKPRGLITASPSNPAGTMLSGEELRALAAYTKQHDIALICDEIYHGVTYGQKAQTVLAYTDEAIVVNSFSKYFRMPGWRLGWAVVPPSMVRTFECLAQNFFISPSDIAQYAAIEVFNCYDDLDAEVVRYDTNRRLLLEALPAIGFDDISAAEGAFFIYANIAKFGRDSAEFCSSMLHETGVVAIAGYDFDPINGNDYIRFSFSGSHADMQEAMRRLAGWVKP